MIDLQDREWDVPSIFLQSLDSNRPPKKAIRATIASREAESRDFVQNAKAVLVFSRPPFRFALRCTPGSLKL
jgi:hypothetical protein